VLISWSPRSTEPPEFTVTLPEEIVVASSSTLKLWIDHKPRAMPGHDADCDNAEANMKTVDRR
jgi:hypothetical protein